MARHQLNTEPLCRMCSADDRISSARVADHVVPHRGDEVKFWFGELQSLCMSCHSQQKQHEESGSTQQLDDDGWPL